MSRSSCFTAIAVLLWLLPWSVSARAPFCAQDSRESYIDISTASYLETDLHPIPPASSDIAHYQLDALLVTDNKQANDQNTESKDSGPKLTVGAGHEYNSITLDRLPPPDPQTNGDVHTLYIALHREAERPDYRYRVSLAPALSTSSNALKNPDQLESEALQLWAAVLYERRVSDKWSWLAGICADHRLGHYQGYPVVGGKWQPEERWLLRLAYPDTRIEFRFRPGFTMALNIGPDGNEWQVFDKDLDNGSRFIREAWLAEGQLRWRPVDTLEFRMAAGRQLDQRLSMVLEDRSRLKVDTDNAGYWQLGLRWYLP